MEILVEFGRRKRAIQPKSTSDVISCVAEEFSLNGKFHLERFVQRWGTWVEFDESKGVKDGDQLRVVVHESPEIRR